MAAINDAAPSPRPTARPVLRTSRRVTARAPLPSLPARVFMYDLLGTHRCAEGVGQPAVRHLPALGQIADDFAGVEWIVFDHLVIEGADRGQRTNGAGDVGVPYFWIDRIEHRRMPTVYRGRHACTSPG